MKRICLAAASLVLAFLSAASTACAGDTVVNSSNELPGISVGGSGTANGTPDIVLLTLGVNVEEASVALARENAAVAMQRVIDSLKGNGVAEKDIQTIDFSINPQYSFDGRTQVLRGYQVSNVVTAKITRIDTSSRVIDDAAAAGGSSTIVQRVQFAIDDPTELQTVARQEAMSQARARAEELAQNANVTLGRALSINESPQTIVPQAQGVVAAPRTGSATSTPIQSGELAIVVNLRVVYAIE